jgi:hypothetical protein
MDEWMTQIESIVASDVKHAELNLMNRKKMKKRLWSIFARFSSKIQA